MTIMKTNKTRKIAATLRLMAQAIALTAMLASVPVVAADDDAAKSAADAQAKAEAAASDAESAKKAAEKAAEANAQSTAAAKAKAQTASEDAQAATEAAQKATDAAAAASVSLDQLMEMLQKQQAQLDQQEQLIKTLQKQQTKITEQEQQIADQKKQIDDQRASMQSMQTQVDQMAAVDPNQLSEEDIKTREKLQTIEESLKASDEASNSKYDTTSFPGSMAIPGTAAAIRIGGFVKMNIVESIDPIISKDRFIVGSIPVPQQTSRSEASITVDQSRLNFDLREQTSFGPLRAFIEGDFAGTGTSFRLRHAFGQYKSFLAGQTWSTFMDNEASPEELDFEGINGRINVRQPEIRYFPEIGKDLNLLVALENPDPQITGGTGISQWPDMVASIRRTWFEIFHVKTALLVRNIEANWDMSPDPNNPIEDSVIGWGLTVSGTTPVPWWDTRDNFLYQVNYGDGYGRYVNDLGTIGEQTGDGFDAIFDPNGQLDGFTVLAYYVALQKWWNDSMRSNFNLSYVDVNNYTYQAADSYNTTWRTSANVIWSPTSRADIGGEILWGQRKNFDGQSADAMQLQFSIKYRY
jgi:hypothetical protein